MTEVEGTSEKEVAELWVLLVEKAWAQVNRGYKAIEGGHPGHAMALITGKASKSFRTSSMDDDDLLEALIAGEKGGATR